MSIRFSLIIVALSFLFISFSPDWANAQLDVRAVKCSNILYQEMNAPPIQKIPQTLIDDAKCIIVIPSLVKAGLVVTVESGKGLAICRSRETGKWGAPAFYNATGGALGLSAGGGSFDVIALVMDEKGVGGLVSESVTFGAAQAAAVAGQTGATAGSHTKGISFFTYTESKDGLFAGADLGGLTLSFNSKGNTKAYGKALSAYETLFKEKTTPDSIKIFREAVLKFAPNR
jgi:lipid-binding SYLF domain-containing protein